MGEWVASAVEDDEWQPLGEKHDQLSVRTYPLKTPKLTATGARPRRGASGVPGWEGEICSHRVRPVSMS